LRNTFRLRQQGSFELWGGKQEYLGPRGNVKLILFGFIPFGRIGRFGEYGDLEVL